MCQERACVCQFNFGESVFRQNMQAMASVRPEVRPVARRAVSVQVNQVEGGSNNAQVSAQASRG